MPPLPDVTHETVILSSASNTTALNGFQSSDELNQTMFNEQDMYHSSLAVDPMESINLSDDDEPPTLTEEPLPQSTTCSAPSTPTGERDPPVIFRKLTTTTSNISILPEVEVRYQGVRSSGSTNSDDNNGLLDTFLGCFKPFFSVMNKFGGNIKSNKNNTNTLSKINDDWEIPIDNIMNDLVLIGNGIEGTVFLGKLAGQNVAYKRVKSKEETNIKHLKKLNHINVIKFRGVSVAPPLFYIVMDYCAYGSLYDVLKRRREKDSYTKPTQVLDWSRQISNGVDYLHSNKIVHRDLKSPNILIADKNILKISDFGTSKELVNRRSQIMSLNGTSAWMAPEVIRHELCSDKVDVWSFGIVLWEILTCAVPYHNIDPTAVMWGVGKGSLTLPIPSSAPDGFRSLMTWCWNQQPSYRPSFQQIIKHLDISEPKIKLFEQEQEYDELKRIWSDEINEYLSTFPTIDISSTLQMSNDELMKKRQEELQHIADIRSHYQKRIQDVDKLYIELKSLKMQLKQREREIREKERVLNMHGNKRTINPMTEARKKSVEIIKAATANLNDPKHLLPHKKRNGNKSNNGSSNSQPSITSNNSPVTNNQDLSNTKNSQRRKKGPSHRRNNSNGSATSWTPPNLSTIEDQEKRRAATNITSNVIRDTVTTNQTSNLPDETTPIPSISADIDSKSNANTRELNPKNLQLDLQNSINSSPSQQRPSTTFPNPLRKSSSSSPEDFDEAPYHNPPKPPRRRRNINPNNNRITSPSSSIKSNPSPTDEQDNKSRLSDDEKQTDVRKPPRNVTFQLSPSIITERNSSIQQRKISKSVTYTSSEEGEVEDIQSDNYILDDRKHRAKHNSSETFSSESEIYGERNNHLGIVSDEGGQLSDDRPASRESMLNSEPEHD